MNEATFKEKFDCTWQLVRRAKPISSSTISTVTAQEKSKNELENWLQLINKAQESQKWSTTSMPKIRSVRIDKPDFVGGYFPIFIFVASITSCLCLFKCCQYWRQALNESLVHCQEPQSAPVSIQVDLPRTNEEDAPPSYEEAHKSDYNICPPSYFMATEVIK